MATVYLALDLKLHRRVALKVLRPELVASLGSERFHREIEIAARLSHPQILLLHDSGEAEGHQAPMDAPLAAAQVYLVGTAFAAQTDPQRLLLHQQHPRGVSCVRVAYQFDGLR